MVTKAIGKGATFSEIYSKLMNYHTKESLTIELAQLISIGSIYFKGNKYYIFNK